MLCELVVLVLKRGIALMAIKCLTNDEYGQLLDFADFEGDRAEGKFFSSTALVPSRGWYLGCRDVAAICCMGEAGLRLGELHRLVWDDLLLSGRCRRVLEIDTLHRVKYVRSIPTSGRFMEAINRLYAAEQIIRPTVKSWESVWRSYARGRELCRRAIQSRISVLGLRSVGRRVWPHMLRHTFATRLLRVTDIRTVQMVLGHTRLESTAVYTHPTIQDAQAAVGQL